MALYTVQALAALAAQKRPAFSVPWRKALMQYQSRYTEAASDCAPVDPCMLAAIVDRESGGANILQRGMPPGPKCGCGVAQITWGVDWSDPKRPRYPGYGDLMDPLVNLRVAAREFLLPALKRFPNDHIDAFAAYNLGISGVASEIAEGLSPDAWTTNGYGLAVFTDWINFSAASMGVDVAWSQYKP